MYIIYDISVYLHVSSINCDIILHYSIYIFLIILSYIIII